MYWILILLRWKNSKSVDYSSVYPSGFLFLCSFCAYRDGETWDVQQYKKVSQLRPPSIGVGDKNWNPLDKFMKKEK